MSRNIRKNNYFYFYLFFQPTYDIIIYVVQKNGFGTEVPFYDITNFANDAMKVS